MAFIRKIKKGNSVYLALVENYREDGKVKQRHLKYLGKEESAQGRLVDPSAEISVSSCKRYLDCAVLDQLSRELGMPEMLGEKSKEILLLVFSHLLERLSIQAIPEWASHTELLELLDVSRVTKKDLSKSLERLNDLDFATIEEKLARYWAEHEDLKEMVVLDVTDTYFNGSTKLVDWKACRGKDGKCSKLLQIGMAVSSRFGLPILHKVYEGNIGDTRIFQDMLTELWRRGITGVVMDRGMCSADNIKRMHDSGTKCILGMKRSGHIKTKYLESIDRSSIYNAQNRIKLASTTVYAKSFEYNKGSLVVIYNPQSEIAQKERAFEKGKDDVDSKYYGFSLIYHNTNLTNEEVVRKYFDKEIVERCFKSLKGPLALHPIRVWLNSHIKAHVKICYLAYAIYSLMLVRLQKINISPSKALKLLASGYKVHLSRLRDGSSWSQTVTLSKTQENILAALKCSV